MKTMYPAKLHKGAHIRVIAPSFSMAILSEETIAYATNCFSKMGFQVSFGKHVYECDQLGSSSIAARVADLHEAFADPSVHAILTAIGGYNSNQLLEYIDWQIIKENPKVFCGYSDITILSNAIYSQTGLITYYGPHFSTFGQKKLDSYQIDYFTKAVMFDNAFKIESAKTWSDDAWYIDQENRNFHTNNGYWIMQNGYAQGRVLGGHLGTTCLLQGTKYMPSLTGGILIIEEDADPSNPREFDRRLQSILQQAQAQEIVGVLIGRFERSYGMSQDLLAHIIQSKELLREKPIIANVDFGHTEPHCTLPIGGMIEMGVDNGGAFIRVLNQ